MVKLIHKCKDRGYFPAVVSSAFPETLSPEIKDWGLEGVFNRIIAGVDDKFPAVQEIIEENGLDPQNTFFVGGTNHEIDVSKKTGIKSVAVTWGFTSEEKLKSRNPDYIVDNAMELEDAIL